MDRPSCSSETKPPLVVQLLDELEVETITRPHALDYWSKASGPHLQAVLLTAVAIVLYGHAVTELWGDWMKDPGASYGVLIPPFALFVAWARKDMTFGIPATPTRSGILVVAGACLLFLLGEASAEYFITRFSLVILLVGLIWTFWGIERLKTLAFPCLLLVTMIPVPTIVYNLISLRLQLFASQFAGGILETLGYTVSTEGNVINLPRISLGIAEACSGLRSLPSFVVMGVIFGFVRFQNPWNRLGMILFSVPLAIFVNISRIAITGMIAYQNERFAIGFYHTFSGWLVFVAGIALFWVFSEGLRRWVE